MLPDEVSLNLTYRDHIMHLHVFVLRYLKKVLRQDLDMKIEGKKPTFFALF